MYSEFFYQAHFFCVSFFVLSHTKMYCNVCGGELKTQIYLQIGSTVLVFLTWLFIYTRHSSLDYVFFTVHFSCTAAQSDALTAVRCTDNSPLRRPQFTAPTTPQHNPMHSPLSDALITVHCADHSSRRRPQSSTLPSTAMHTHKLHSSASWLDQTDWRLSMPAHLYLAGARLDPSGTRVTLLGDPRIPWNRLVWGRRQMMQSAQWIPGDDAIFVTVFTE